ncbi:hypothetical protein VP1G_09152 [Cytospora mali]|uniref:CorA-like transporter domain-containing protein n=1 Tax=Cytospora mali TaxID=578113 RepID=A0A194VDF2_CYTMA|nr:hypothetical protein VP1G_09152 [Valsa mali var. pyri (nom. inval.)]
MASYLPLPSVFQQSYLQKDSYPSNIIERTIGTYPSGLEEYKKRLEDAAVDLCYEPDVRGADVSFYDLQADNGTGTELEKHNLRSIDKLTEWLTIRVVWDGIKPENSVVAVEKKDPNYIYGQNSRARLKITRPMLVEILSFHQVMPDYLDFLLIFGLQSQQNDLGFSSFREQTNLTAARETYRIDSLARSGKQYQLCYNLKGVTCTFKERLDPIKNQYSIRQAAIYHRFDVVGGNTVWIVTKGGLDLYNRFKELTGDNARPEERSFSTPEECFRSSLSAHLLFCYWSTEDWRGYIKWLENMIDDKTKLAVLGPVGKGHHHRLYTPGDIQDLLLWGEKVTEAITVLEYNVDIMDSLRNFYIGLGSNKDCEPAMTCHEDVDIFTNNVSNMIHDFKRQIFRSKALVKLLSDRTELVKQLRIERMNYHMENEAIVVRIITIVTLIYLPATFTSTFFSTDIIKYQGQNSPAGKFSQIAMNRWLEVTIPLSFLTIIVAYVGKKWAESQSLLGDSDEDHGNKKRRHTNTWSSSFAAPRSNSIGPSKGSNRSLPLLPLQNPAG